MLYLHKSFNVNVEISTPLTGWKMHDAVRVVNGLRNLDVYIEQPCLSYEECVLVRRMCTLPFVIDESMDDIGMCCIFVCLVGCKCTCKLKMSPIVWLV